MMEKIIKILITGGSGFIGSYLRKNFRNDYEVISLDNRQAPDLDICHELSNNQKTFDLLKEIKPNFIIHTAAAKDLIDCETNRIQAWQNNVVLTEKISDFCQQNDIHLIYTSSDQVFNGIKGNYRENDIANPINWYGATKTASEYILRNRPNTSICRVSLAYGKAPDYLLSGLEKMVQEQKITNQSLLPYYIITCLQLKKEVVLPEDIIASPTSLHHIALGIKSIIDKKMGGIFHFGGLDQISRYEFARQIAHQFNLNTDLIRGGQDATANLRPRDASLNCEQTNSMLEITGEQITLVSGINQFIHEGGFEQITKLVASYSKE